MKNSFHRLTPGVGPKLMLRMNRVRGRGVWLLAISHGKTGRQHTDWHVTAVSSAMQGLEGGIREAGSDPFMATDESKDGARMGRADMGVGWPKACL